MREAEITVDGKALSPAQVMAVRVACGVYHDEMKDPEALGDDEHGRAMTALYRQRLGEVLRLLMSVPV